MLVNVNIMDDERAAKNVENKMSRPDYNPYDDGFDEAGVYRGKAVLDKYNELLEGEQKKSFRLGANGMYDASDERMIERLNEEHKSRAIKLDMDDLRPATDYFTPQEAEAFKKPKKVRKVLRKAKMLKADDLLPLETTTTGSKVVKKEEQTMGIVSSDGNNETVAFNNRRMKREEAETGGVVSLKDVEADLLLYKKERKRHNRRLRNDDDDDEKEEGEDESTSSEDEDDDEIDLSKLREQQDLKEILDEENNVLEELHSVLNKTRKRLIEPTIQIKQEPEINEKQEPGQHVSFDHLNTVVEDGDENTALTLDTMTEFCRNLGNVPTTSSGSAQLRRSEDDEEDDDDDARGGDEMDVKEANGSGANEREDEEDGSDVEMNGSGPVKPGESSSEAEETGGILDDEPTIDRGLGSCLKLALNKGYFGKEKDKQNARLVKPNIEAQNFTIEEKNYYDIDDKYNRQRDRFGGPTTEFDEKSNYKPDVKLDYFDEKGHAMNEKEAFRYLSHRFHGKGSGKKKTEKRNKKYQEMETMQKMSSIDTPLNTVALLVEKQKRLQQPFVVLSAQKGGKQDQVTLHKR